MKYVFDTSPLSALFKSYYRKRFKTLWEKFDELVDDGRLLSTREVLQEIKDGPLADLELWADSYSEIFAIPTAAEGSFIAGIYSVTHFQQNIEQQKLMKGGRNADPFVIAKAAVDGAAVVTMEILKPNAAKIPNICEHFGVICFSLEEFMEQEGWEF